MRCVLYSIYIFGVLDFTHTQFLALGAKSQKPANLCDNSKTALVEQFFNIVFNEFHSTPPVCVCVQMCPEHPTYCYPNGCLKRSVDKRVVQDTPIASSSDNTKPLMLFVDEKKDLMGDIFGNHVDESKLLKNEKTFIKKLRPDPFKDRYKMLFRYKKLPRVELRYHHGEQIKNMKSDNTLKFEQLDVSNTRWPSNKNRRSSKRIYIEPQNENVITSNTKFNMPIFKETKIPSYPSKYFKRELRNVTSEPEEEKESVNIEAIYVIGNTDSNHTEFSIETLIDDIIKNSLERKSTPLDTTLNNTNDNDQANETNIKVQDPIEKVIKENITIPNNVSTNIISINFENENVDKNMYLEGDARENNTENYTNMIATLSKKIEMQNNTSLEMMRHVLGKPDMEITTNDKYIDDTTKAVTTENLIPSIVYELKVTKKSKQRLARKLQNSKTN